jgi:Holliday junction resolvasome RuvABC ATP-dependent DNA helicase subunit
MLSVNAAIDRLVREAESVGVSDEEVFLIRFVATRTAELFGSLGRFNADPIGWIPSMPHRFAAAGRACAQFTDGPDADDELDEEPLYRALTVFAFPSIVGKESYAPRLLPAYLAVARAAAARAGAPAAARHLRLLEEILGGTGLPRWYRGSDAITFPDYDDRYEDVEALVYELCPALDVEASGIVAEFAYAFARYTDDREDWKLAIGEGLRLYVSFLASVVDVPLSPHYLSSRLASVFGYRAPMIEEDWMLARMRKFRPSTYFQTAAGYPEFFAVCIDAAHLLADRMRVRLIAEHGPEADRDVEPFQACLKLWSAHPDPAAVRWHTAYFPALRGVEGLASPWIADDAGPAPAATGYAAARAAAYPVVSAYATGRAPQPVPPAPSPADLLASALGDLDTLVGLDSVKAELNRIADYVRVQRRRSAAGLPTTPLTHHMVFVGNPGTGKTTVARIAGRLFAALGLLSSGHCIEVARQDLVAEYVGQTATKTAEVIDRARGGILFIDEAYSLAPDDRNSDYGSEAVETLLLAMEQQRDDLIVIVAGYPAEMERFISSNPGLRSRFARTLSFADYRVDELIRIFEGLAADDGYTLGEGVGERLTAAFKRARATADAGNARAARNLFDDVRMRHAARVAADEHGSLTVITADDVPQAGGPHAGPAAALDVVLAPMEALVGLDALKQDLRNTAAVAQLRKLRADQGLPVVPAVTHLALSGNAGTGKTTVGRLIGGVYQSMGVLPSGHVIEAGRADLVGKAVGQTAPLVTNLIRRRSVGSSSSTSRTL